MNKFKSSLFYIGIIGCFSILMYWIVFFGAKLELGRNIVKLHFKRDQWNEFTDSLAVNLGHPLAILLVQIIAIIVTARLFGWICNKIGQPTVVGEIAAGIVLGPSLIGMYFPEFSGALFPEESLGNLNLLSQIGLIFFMFVVGMELDLKVLRNKAHDAVVISHASIIFPFALGMGLAYFMYQGFAPAGVPFLSFGLFMGIAMSITAFPVLARIVQERGLHKTRLGTMVITCAAADDITAWCILAAVIALVKAGSFVSTLYIFLLALGYIFLMIKVVRPFLRRVGDLYSSKENLSKPIVAIFFLTLIISSLATEVIGIHALFGAFMAGAIMPENSRFRITFIEKVEDVALVLLLPLFFVLTGLRTEIGLLNDPYLWGVTGLIILVAVTGKFMGSAVAAKFMGQNWKDSLMIGTLMNTRGLMELVVLNIGYDLGVLTPEIFAMMVIMALVTTSMTGPALDLINFAFKGKGDLVPLESGQSDTFRILISFGNPEGGRSLLRLASSLVKNPKGGTRITAMHLSPVNELHHYNIDEYEEVSFAPIIEESQRLHQKITTLFKASNNIEADITEVADQGNYDLLLVGVGQSIYEGSMLGKILGFTTRIINPDRLISQVKAKENPFGGFPFDERTRSILSRSNVPVGVLIDKGFVRADQIFIPIFSVGDSFLVFYGKKFINNPDARITFLDTVGAIKSNAEFKEAIGAMGQIAPDRLHSIDGGTVGNNFLRKQDLMLVSSEGWKELMESKSLWLSDIPATLIIGHK